VYLVEARLATEFADAVAELAERHPAIRLQLTGPWPPYSFAALDVASTAEQEEPRR
jgi:Gas vesicle synthesis protein GvpL/GvpF